MSIIIILSLYLVFLAVVWWFFIVAKIHAYKFKNFSSNIEKVTKILFIILLILSILWFVLIFSLDFSFFEEINTQNTINIY